MGIEKDIRQTKFNSEYEKAAINILFTGSWLYHINFQQLKKFGITPEQFNVLRILRGSHPKKMKLSDISGRMLDKSSNCTRLVEKLRQKGLVSREICSNNRRQVDITILDKGLSLLTKIDNGSDELISQFKGIKKTEAAELNRILDKVRKSSEKEQ